MKYFTWDNNKNEKLRKERGISFEEIIFHIERGDILDILEHPNPKKYRSAGFEPCTPKDQRIFVINVKGYAYLVPFEETNTEVILKTIIPSRKATKNYLKGGKK